MQILPHSESAINESDVLDVLVQPPCKKNPGHPRFIPVKQFKEEDIPIEARCNNIWQIIKDQGLRTVKLTVYYTTDRPANFDVGLPAASRRGRSGTGWVDLFDNSIKGRTGFKTGKTFMISTAAHVIFDNRECGETKVEFFFDDDYNCKEVIEARGHNIVLLDTSLDVCRFLCHTSDTVSGNKIRERLREIPRYYPPVPPIENIAWCISHPHGMAQRLTFGRITDIKEEEATWSWAVLKLLVYQCATQGSIAEKKIFYVFFRDTVNGINLYLADDLGEKSKKQHKEQLLGHLVDKGLIVKPTREEAIYIRGLYNELTANLSDMRDKAFYSKFKHSVELISNAKEKEEKHKLYKHIVLTEAMKVRVSPKFLERFNEIEKELWVKRHNLLFGGHYQNLDLSLTKSSTYSLDSCPGSSGARVTAYVMTNEGLRRHIGHHSRGLKENQGIVCGGGGSILVPTTPIPAELKNKYNITSGTAI